eukprot:scaffold19266_cov87-Skeletonema_menzelii.AAC.1
MEEQRDDAINGGGRPNNATNARKRWSTISRSLKHEVTSPTEAATDASLLLASLEHAPVEDEAEAALIEVLERRQVTFDANLPFSTPMLSHRRVRTSTELPSPDNMLNGNNLGKLSPSRTKPPLAARRGVTPIHRRPMMSRGASVRDRLGSGDVDQVLAGRSGG